jgi:hypothetical protein
MICNGKATGSEHSQPKSSHVGCTCQGTGLPEIFGAQLTAPGVPDAGPDGIGFIAYHACLWFWFGLILPYFLLLLPFGMTVFTLDALYFEM